MKTLIAGIALLMLVAAGCNESTPGGPGVQPNTTTTAHKPVIGEAEQTFTLTAPQLSTHLKQGESKDISISMNRGKNFDDDVTLTFTDIPKGLTVTPAGSVIKHGDKETHLTFAAAADAALGDFTIKVTGHPSKGTTDAVTELKLTVDEK